MKYRPEIDGLRAVAVLPVLLFHAGVSLFGGGYVGVDVFFVISGYLITTIIIDEIVDKKFSIVRFYERRARRILPALFFVLILSTPVAWIVLQPIDFKAFSVNVAAVAAFLSNVQFFRESGYFDQAAELKPLLHTWSLAVEEQFYVFFPLMLLGIWRFGKTTVLVTLLIVFCMSLTIAHLSAVKHPSAAFFLPHTRAWELLLGSFAAIYLQNRHSLNIRFLSNALSLLGLLAILFSVIMYDAGTPFPSLYALVPTVGTTLIILFAVKGTITHRILSLRVLVWIGLISYSLYLWHQPILAFLRHIFGLHLNVVLVAAALTASFCLAIFSYHFVERPFRDKKRIGQRTIFAASSLGTIAAIAFGLFVHFQYDYIREVWLNHRSETQRSLTLLLEQNPARSGFMLSENETQDISPCQFNTPELTPSVIERLSECSELHSSTVVILGDSHAIDLFGIVASRFEDAAIIGLTNHGCRPHGSNPACVYDSFLSLLAEQPNVVDHVIYEQAGFYLLKGPNGNTATRSMFAGLALDKPVTGIEINSENINATYNYLHKLSAHTSVSWFGPRIEPHISKRDILRLGCNHNFQPRPGSIELFNILDQSLAEISEVGGSVKYISQIDTFDFRFPEDFMSCSELYWSDGDHLSVQGEIKFGQRLPSDFLTPDLASDRLEP